MKIQSTYDACAIVEGFADFTPTAWQELQAWAYIIKTGAWRSLQGWYGRTAHAIIEDGLVTRAGQITDKGKQYKEL